MRKNNKTVVLFTRFIDQHSMKKWILAVFLLLLFALIMGCTSQNTTQATPQATQSSGTGSNNSFSGKYIDVNVHFKPADMSVEDLIKNMDNSGLDTAINLQTVSDIFHNNDPKGYGFPDSFKSYPGRILFLYGNPGLSLLDSVVTRGSYTGSEQQQYIQDLEDAMKSGEYVGFGQVGLRHMPDKNPGEADIIIPGDHPWMFIMSDIAAKYNVPIEIHMDVQPDDLARLEKLLYHNNNTKIIWENAGWQTSGPDAPTDYVSPDLWRKLFEQHPSLYTSIKIRPNMGTGAKNRVDIFDKNNQIKPEWMQLFEDYPNRFMMGCDLKPNITNHTTDGFENTQFCINLLQQLPPNIERKFERDNAITIYNLRGMAL